jgi:hypothetical protein
VAPDTFAQAATDMAQDALSRAEAAGLAPADLADIRAAAQLAQTPSETPVGA